MDRSVSFHSSAGHPYLVLFKCKLAGCSNLCCLTIKLYLTWKVLQTIELRTAPKSWQPPWAGRQFNTRPVKIASFRYYEAENICVQSIKDVAIRKQWTLFLLNIGRNLIRVLITAGLWTGLDYLIDYFAIVPPFQWASFSNYRHKSVIHHAVCTLQTNLEPCQAIDVHKQWWIGFWKNNKSTISLMVVSQL